MYGRKYMGIVRTTFLIGLDQRIVRVWPKVSVTGHAEEVLAALKAR
jgi:peroxiredoxin Q/BCP